MRASKQRGALCRNALDSEVLSISRVLTFASSPSTSSPLPPPIHSPLQRVSGVTDVSLFKGKASIVGRSSPLSLYSKHLSSMDAHGTWNPQDSTGFIRINAVRLKAHYLREANILSGAAKKTQLK